MNLFEKIFNYQIMSQLEDTGTSVITAQERSWLRTMLQHPSAIDAFSPVTLDKLQSILATESLLELTDSVSEKARSQENQLVPPLLRELRRQITNKAAIHLTYTIKNGRYFGDEVGFPYKLEYSMVKREWYLLWYHLRHKSLFSTRLKNIVSVSPAPYQVNHPDSLINTIQHMLEQRKQQATIEIGREFNRELSRILYAFSCFEKEVNYDDSTDTYSVRLTFLNNDSEYVLSKLRFLGKRVKVTEGQYLQRRMLESAMRALGRYEE